MDFQTRAKLTDAAVWAALVNQVGTLTAPEDVEAVLSGAMMAVARLAHRTQAEPDAASTVKVLTEAARGAVQNLGTDAL
jgi:hypothetical protein